MFRDSHPIYKTNHRKKTKIQQPTTNVVDPPTTHTHKNGSLHLLCHKYKNVHLAGNMQFSSTPRPHYTTTGPFTHLNPEDKGINPVNDTPLVDRAASLIHSRPHSLGWLTGVRWWYLTPVNQPNKSVSARPCQQYPYNKSLPLPTITKEPHINNFVNFSQNFICAGIEHYKNYCRIKHQKFCGNKKKKKKREYFFEEA